MKYELQRQLKPNARARRRRIHFMGFVGAVAAAAAAAYVTARARVQNNMHYTVRKCIHNVCVLFEYRTGIKKWKRDRTLLCAVRHA